VSSRSTPVARAWRRALACLLFLLVPALAEAQAAASPRAARSVLFVGNSFTFGDPAGGPDLVRPFGAATVTDLNGAGIGGVPALFKRFTEQAGLDYDVSLETAPGQGLDFHYENRLALIDRPWDVVVLQSYSTLDVARPGNPAKLITYSARLADTLSARNPDVEIYLVATWSRADQTYLRGGHWYRKPIDAMARSVEAGYEAARARTPRIKDVIRVGAAWSRAMRTGFADPNPYDRLEGGKVDLWAPDGYHASVFGYYLEALMHFGAITGVDPRTLGARETAAPTLGITPTQAAALQAIASDQLAARGAR
jgi:hypothetical protein